VDAAAKESVGMLVLRVWSEGDGRLRARITDSNDVFSGEQRTLAAVGVEEICTVIRTWLEVFEDGAAVTSP
jgi:hypothetical protein